MYPDCWTMVGWCGRWEMMAREDAKLGTCEIPLFSFKGGDIDCWDGVLGASWRWQAGAARPVGDDGRRRCRPPITSSGIHQRAQSQIQKSFMYVVVLAYLVDIDILGTKEEPGGLVQTMRYLDWIWLASMRFSSTSRYIHFIANPWVQS